MAEVRGREGGILAYFYASLAPNVFTVLVANPPVKFLALPLVGLFLIEGTAGFSLSPPWLCPCARGENGNARLLFGSCADPRHRSS